MLTTTATLLIALFALPRQAQAQNSVTIDGVEKTIRSMKFFESYGDDNAFSVNLCLSTDKKEYVSISGNKDLHATYNDIDLTKKEPVHEGQQYWKVSYEKDGKTLFDAYAKPDLDYALFTAGKICISGDPRFSRKICGISLGNGEITDTKNGDGKKHTLKIDYKYERTKPTAGTLTVGNVTSYTVTGLEPGTEYEVNIRIKDESGNYNRYGMQTVTTKGEKTYDLEIAGTQVTSANCGDLSVIDGVSGTVKYDPDSKVLTLKNATINVSGENEGIRSKIEGMIIHVEGTNTITTGAFSALMTEKSHCTISGGGKLNLSGKYFGLYAMWKSFVTIEDCEINCGGSFGTNNIDAEITINNSTVTAKSKYYIFGTMRGIRALSLDGCTITQPAGAAFDASLGGVALNGELVKTKVTITKGATGIDAVTADMPAHKRGIYTLQGVKMNTAFDRLPAGVYIVDGKKVVKK
ncbi:hypothetical protein C3V39_01170 [Prevotella sp. oral taxon 820]|nr:hypothetical protein C3V39_01170 [Prevotella sp. oral taxon 820]